MAKKKKIKTERSYEGTLGDGIRISYSEGCKVAIGDYESRDVHLSMSMNVPEDQEPKKAFQQARRITQDFLKIREKKIRQSAEDDVDFETMDRLDYYN